MKILMILAMIFSSTLTFAVDGDRAYEIYMKNKDSFSCKPQPRSNSQIVCRNEKVLCYVSVGSKSLDCFYLNY